MKNIRLVAALLLTALCAFIAVNHNPIAAAVLFFIGGHALQPWSAQSWKVALTLTSTEILADVIAAFTKQFPALNRMGTDFRPSALKLNQQYIAHIPSIPTVEDVSTTYAITGNDARSLLTDVPITVDKHKGCRLYWSHFDSIKDNKQKYEEVVSLAGYALAKSVIDNLLSGVTTMNFSQSSTVATADCDLDMLIDVCGDMNSVGAIPSGRVLLVNTAVANTLSVDSRITSKDYAGQIVNGSALRRWTNIGGFAEIIEYPDFPTNNGTALSSCTGEADDDLVTKTAHGLVTGQPVVFTSGTGFTGLTEGVKYYAIRVSADTFSLAATNALALAGTAINITTDGTSGVFTPTENLVAFAFERRAFALLSGIPDGMDQQNLISQLGITQLMDMDTVTEGGVTMAAMKWQDVGTGKLNWVPTLVWGKALGRQGGTNAAGALCDYAGHRIISA